MKWINVREIGIISDNYINAYESSLLYENYVEFTESSYRDLQMNSLYKTDSTAKKEPISSHLMTPSNFNVNKNKVLNNNREDKGRLTRYIISQGYTVTGRRHGDVVWRLQHNRLHR